MPLTLGCNLSIRDALRFEEMAKKQGLSKTGLVQELVLEYLESGGASRAATLNEAELEESQAQVAQLQEKLNRAEGKTIDDFESGEKARYFLDWLSKLSPENKAILAEKTGFFPSRAEPEITRIDELVKPEPVGKKPEPVVFKTERVKGRDYRIYPSSEGLGKPSQISWDLFSGKEKWVDLEEEER